MSKVAVPAHKNYLIIEICCNRMSDDEDVDVPYVKLTLSDDVCGRRERGERGWIEEEEGGEGSTC